ncbi:solute carrier family 2, facilitated glucose transporter member 10 [Lates calcarifer]|uniref:Solute carrier family 2, facilitated glucose transporter member 10 n=1 Tax=Lates calcarifer TaxID=8187 RepID=A0A4W6E701_LATCA|nr:solute carrier family 2, facilitated glucose transporter member 10 [Lates calcarifer]XP_018523075.1 solute carrier family 2, facilitated glucose transporter member 10 [Lates calcarifer]
MGLSILLLASVVSTLGGLVFGYELGIISGALLQMKAEFRLSCFQQEALVSSLLIGALLASIVGGCLIDRHGRRNTILLSNILILTGSLILLISSYPALVVGRVTVGFAICISSMSCCIYVSEIVTPDHRGFLVTLYESGITVGILAAYAINYILSDSRRGWKWMFGFAIVPTLVQLVSILFLPSSTTESLRYNCCQAERDLLSPTETQEGDDSKVSSSKDNEKVQYDSMYLFQRKDNMRTRTVIGLGLVLFQQFTGQPNVLFYASTIFHSVGFQSNSSAVLASVGLGLVKVIATVTSMVFSDRAGRRPLLISGCSVMALCLIIIGLLSEHSVTNAKRSCNSEDFNINITDLPLLTPGNKSVFDMPLGEKNIDNKTQDENFVFDKVGHNPLEPVPESSSSIYGPAVNWIILLCMMAVVSAYSVGFGPMTWLLLSEIFPAAVRGRAFAFTNCFNWAANLLVTFTFLNAVDMIGLSRIFLLYGMTAVAAGIFFYFMLPETKGKTLEEIDKELRWNRFYHKGECCGCIRWRKTFPQYQRVHCQISTSG